MISQVLSAMSRGSVISQVLSAMSWGSVISQVLSVMSRGLNDIPGVVSNV